MIVEISVFLLTAIALHLIHARIALEHPHLNVPAGRVLFEITPSTKLARRITARRITDPLSRLYFGLWLVHLASGILFAVALLRLPFA